MAVPAASTVGKVNPPSVENRMFTVAQLIGARVVDATSQVTTSVVFPVPPPDLQHRFAAIVESVEKQKTSQRAHLDELDTLFASLQSRAFRGDL